MPEQRSRLVYSTDGTGTPGDGRVRPATKPSARTGAPKRGATRPPAADVPDDGFVRIKREKKGRGGKTVTTVTGLPGGEADLEAMLKVLKQLCGAGGSREGATLEIQGDHRERVQAKLESLGHRVKLAGG
ncbi:MAG: hypothetical protein WCQ48_05360 [Chloroflexota bacterium]